MSGFLPLERTELASPAWFVPFDEFARRVRTAGVVIRLDRFENGGWLPLDDVAVRTPSGALAYPGLGRGGDPAAPRRYRARFTAAGYEPFYPADDQPFSAGLLGIEFLVPADGASGPAAPRLIRLLPGISYPYAPGIRLVSGFVFDAVSGAPVANALVEALGRTSRDLVPWRERTLSDATGAFRLALRWEGEKAEVDAVEETFHLSATERPGRTGSLEVRLPRDLGLRQVIRISES